jgi:hypothetical protein
MLDKHTELARALRCEIAIALGDEQCALDPRSRAGWTRAACDDFALVLDDGEHLAGWRLEVRPSARLLARCGAQHALGRARRIAEILLEVVDERVRRLDLCVDLSNLTVGELQLENFTTQRRAGRRQFGVFQEHARSDRTTGLTVGRGDLVLRVYDKLEELRQGTSPSSAERRAEEYSRWLARGWDGTAPITRVEFQLRGAALKEIGDGALRVPDGALESLDPTWQYLTRHWVRVAVPGSRVRRDRWPTAAWWQAVQEAKFGNPDGEVATRVRRRSTARARQVASTAITYGVRSGALAPYPRETDARKLVEDWSDDRAATFVSEQMQVALRSVAFAASGELVDAFGPREAAAFLLEKQTSEAAKFSTIEKFENQEVRGKANGNIQKVHSGSRKRD